MDLLSISVVVATKDRADQLHSVSLPSLARQQEAPPFEVLVWDASEGDTSLRVVEAFTAAHPEMAVRYARAPRVGLARQRNDAVRQATADVVFFIDDDSEVSSDGLRALSEMFAGDGTLSGGCLPLLYEFPPGTEPANLRAKQPQTGVLRSLLQLYYRLFEPAKKASGYYPPMAPTPGAPVGYLFGCDMAFRREVFAAHRFDERLHRFTNYLICDDLIFSRALLQQGCRLRVADSGQVIHRAAAGGRLRRGFALGRVEGYSAGLVWIVTALPWSRWSVLAFLWARTGVFFGMLLHCLRAPWEWHRWQRLAGYVAGLGTVVWEELPRRKRSGQS